MRSLVTMLGRRFVALTALAVMCAVLAGCAAGLPQGVVYPSITPAEGEQPRVVTREFMFEGQPVSITITVDGGLYAGAVAAEKAAIRFGNARETTWIEDYYPAFMDEPHQERFYADLLAVFRAIREARGLDADRYAELLCVFAQSLDYRTDPVDLSPKFPVETFVEGYGDCDDKALLLGGLLSREGYDVAILLFEPEQHVALGIRSEDLAYRDTGYAFVETTTQGFVGMTPETIGDGVTLESQPQIFPVGAGTMAYTAGDDVQMILDARAQAIAQAKELAEQVDEADAGIASLEAETDAARKRLDALKASGDFHAYNAAIPSYNALVARFNQAVADRNDLADRYNVLVDLESAIVKGLDNRVGVLKVVRTWLQ